MRVISQILNRPVVCVDIETDGMNHLTGHIIEVAAIRIENGAVVDEFKTLINPGIKIPYFITNLTGITTDDVAAAPTFEAVSDRLQEILNGAVFVAHNARFDYSFLRQEFRRLDINFDPKQLCTVKLSRRLYPAQRSHKLASLISEHGFSYAARHRAYDDAHILVQFLDKIEQEFDHETLQSAISQQLRQPSLPKHLDPKLIADLPPSHGVYIFEDETGSPLYIGKSVNIKRRVLSHFTADKDSFKELKISQTTHNISFQQTSGELEALLLESHLIKTMQPLHNRRLRRVRKLVATRRNISANGYIELTAESIDQLEPDEFDRTLALHPNRNKQKTSLLMAVKTFDLCPKLCGLEKSRGACFSYRLGKCRGACVGQEPAENYNRRLLLAFERKKIDRWPFAGAVIIEENLKPQDEISRGFIVDQWSIVGTITQEEDFEPQISRYEASFDLDAYKILHSFITTRSANIRITPYQPHLN